MAAASIVTERKSVGSILLDSLGYMTGQLGVMLIGVLTFPLFTRVLSRADYGLLSLTNTSLSLLGLLVGLGLPNAVVRFQAQHQNDGERLRFNSTQLSGSTLIAAVGSLAVIVVSFSVPGTSEFSSTLVALRYAALALVSRAATNILLEFFRLAQRVKTYNLLSLSQRIGNAAFGVAAYLIYRNVYALVLGCALGETLVAVLGIILAHRARYWALISLDFGELSGSVKFAVPLMLANVCSTVMAYGDRYLILGFLGPETVAGYAVAYDLCGYVQVLILTSFRLGILPELVSRYTSAGPEAASQFLSKALRYVSWIVIGAAFGLVATGEETTTLLASSKYQDAGALFYYLVPGVLLTGLDFLFAAGLYLRKRNDLWFLVTCLSTVLNLGVNVFMIPRYGIRGAAITTLCTYILQETAVYFVARRYLRLQFDIVSLASSAASGLTMYLVIVHIRFSGLGLYNLAIKTVVGVGLYAVMFFLFEKEARQILWRTHGRKQLATGVV